MAERSVPALLLAAAKRDEQAFRALAAIPDMNDAVIGFHAHQCVEKALKAVLAYAGTPYRRTHRIRALVELLKERRRGSPPFSERLDELQPYAVEARYGFVEPTGFDRDMIAQIVEAVVSWAESELSVLR